MFEVLYGYKLQYFKWYSAVLIRKILKRNLENLVPRDKDSAVKHSQLACYLQILFISF